MSTLASWCVLECIRMYGNVVQGHSMGSDRIVTHSIVMHSGHRRIHDFLKCTALHLEARLNL